MKKFINSFKYAFFGIVTALKTQRNFRIMVYLAIFAIILANILNLQTWEKIGVYLSIALVLSFELLNTALEQALNEITTNYSENIKNAKDMMAGAVLVASIFSLLIGLMIFFPKIFHLLK